MNDAHLVFALDQTATLTSIPVARLRRWDMIGLYHPKFKAENTRAPFSRMYAFDDIVALRTLEALRQRGIPTAELHAAARELKRMSSISRHDQRLFVDPVNQRVYGSGDQDVSDVNRSLDVIDLASIEHDTRAAIDRLRERTPAQIGNIIRHRYIMSGVPVIDGTRIPVETIMGFIDDRYSAREIVAEFPRLTEQDVQAAIDFTRNTPHSVIGSSSERSGMKIAC